MKRKIKSILVFCICVLLIAQPLCGRADDIKAVDIPSDLETSLHRFLMSIASDDYESAAQRTMAKWCRDAYEEGTTPEEKIKNLKEIFYFDYSDTIQISFDERVYVATDKFEGDGYQLYLHNVEYTRENGEYRFSPDFLLKGMPYREDMEEELIVLFKSTVLYTDSIPDGVLNHFLSTWENGRLGDGAAYVSRRWKSKYPDIFEEAWFFFNLEDSEIVEQADQNTFPKSVLFTVKLIGEGETYYRQILVQHENYIWYIMLDGVEDLFLDRALERANSGN